jgi:DNA end-binding protein Ku
MHSLFYANEVRNVTDIAKAENAELSGEEIDLGAHLIESMSDEFRPDKYRDEYRERVQAMLDEKTKAGRSRLPHQKRHDMDRSLT